MIKHVRGNLLEADVEALVNTVNTVGVMGKGIALQFKRAFPDNYNAYKKACNQQEVRIGKMFVYHTDKMINPRYIINFPTKQHWKGKSSLTDIEDGIKSLMEVIRNKGIKSIAIPPLGCGNGGLRWVDVLNCIEAAFEELPDINVVLYEPSGVPKTEDMPMTTKRPEMKSSRAALICLIEKYIIPGYRLTLIEIQKLAYFLQVAGEPLNLNFVKGKYGPYAEALNHVLRRMEGHFITGYGDKSCDASIRLTASAIEEAREILQCNQDTSERLETVMRLIDGYESPYGIELLSTVHWLGREYPAVKENFYAAMDGFKSWSEYKEKTFNPEHIKKAWSRLREHRWL
ncbi:MAG: macro domain-containing protein [Nitrospirae bacterium]|uniref:type II toxin-antitoxin system antitoxin DNA ADP-ribosyl glycohydrolase DarG n=1 Tax=Candidatus Magnetobacterium casense TaxID=1455061 RepID=UPI00058AD464|nr:macro domain-containing protein [Candidatus Magnetobacterium casensis]MBF0338593.1 macro domain-containing protein [Nitrospirota bacterium]